MPSHDGFVATAQRISAQEQEGEDGALQLMRIRADIHECTGSMASKQP